MLRWCHGEGMDMTLIETMPLGDIEGDRTDQYLPLSVVRARLMDRLTLEDIPYRTGGPARYVQVRETGGRLGFITPLTHNFCETCNRVRITCTGTLFMCLGQNDAADLRAPLRASASDDLVERRHRRGHRPQAQGPRLRHRPPRAKARRGAPHEPDRRLSRVGAILPSLPSPCPSPSKLAKASLHLSVAASASGCGWRGDARSTAATGFPLPWGEGWGEGSCPMSTAQSIGMRGRGKGG